MGKVNTYPEMNRQIIKLLEMTGDNVCLYAAQRIRELEEHEHMTKIRDWHTEMMDEL